jgi:hypothetical protein
MKIFKIFLSIAFIIACFSCGSFTKLSESEWNDKYNLTFSGNITAFNNNAYNNYYTAAQINYSVKITEQTAGTSQIVNADSSGNYSFSNVAAGTYNVTINILTQSAPFSSDYSIQLNSGAWTSSDNNASIDDSITPKTILNYTGLIISTGSNATLNIRFVPGGL